MAFVVILVIAVLIIRSWITDYTADIRGRKEVALQIERMKSRVYVAPLTEAIVQTLAKTKLSALEAATYHYESARYEPLAQAWAACYVANPNAEAAADRRRTIIIWVSDSSRLILPTASANGPVKSR